jgi:Rieske 2Fe-2S family protein
VSIIDRERYFTSLPREYYLDADRFERELERVWFEQWFYVGHVSQIPAPGDWFTSELQSESFVITRDQTGAIHALLNTCRHRGLRLCDGETGHARRLVCPYHSWSYGLDGCLLNATRQPDGESFSYAELGLKRAHVDVWKGFIFISLAGSRPKPVAEMIGPEYAALMDKIEPEKLRIAHTVVYDLAANWKLLLENGVECYHCVGVHPEFCVTLDTASMTGYYGGTMTLDTVQGLTIPLDSNVESLSRDGKYVSSKLLGEFGRGLERTGSFSEGFMTQPGYCWGTFHADYGMVASTLPVSPVASKMICQWFVRDDAEEGVDYDLDKVVEIWDITNRQDVAILERQQLGLSSRFYEPGPNSVTQEPGIHASLQLYLSMMGETV